MKPFNPAARPAALPALLLTAALTACTGTVEQTPPATFALLTGGGEQLQLAAVGTRDAASAPAAPAAPAATLGDPVPVPGGVTLHAQPDGRSFTLTRRSGLERRSADLSLETAFAALPFDPCLVTTAASPGGDRLLTVSQCDLEPQRAALYRADGTLLWTATLPLAVQPVGESDAAPVRAALVGDVGIVARPVVGGGSETLRVSARHTGDTVAEVSPPRETLAIRDLAAYSVASGTTVYAATDAGVYPLTADGVPDAAALPAFGAGRFDRLWASEGNVGSRPVLAAWGRSAYGSAATPLRLWDGASTDAGSALTVASYNDLQDVAFAGGYLYALTGNTLARYDAITGIRQGNWRSQTLLTRLNDARALVQVRQP